MIFQSIALAERCLRDRQISDRADLRQIRNFLVLQYESPLGSIVHATPVLEALKTAIPHAHITVAASSMAASVLGNSPYIDRCVITPNPFTDFLEACAAVRSLYQTMPPGERAIITTIGNQRSWLGLLGLFAGPAVRAGYTLASELYDLPLQFDPERGQIEGNLDIVRALGHNAGFCEPRVFFTSKDAAHAAGLLAVDVQDARRPRIAFVTQNSGGQPNRWSAERFQQVIASLSRTFQAIPIFLGTSGDAPAIEKLRQELRNKGLSLAGKTTISELAAVLAQCDLIVSLDTGTFHVARAVGLPGVVIAPAWQSASEWLPVGNPRYHVLQGPRISKPPADYQIQEIGVDEVIESALDILHRCPPCIKERKERLDRSTIRL